MVERRSSERWAEVARPLAHAALAVGALVACSLVACNAVTGASDVEYVEGAGGNGLGETTAGSGAASATGTTTVATGTGATASTTTTGAQTGSTVATASAAMASSSSGGACTYPAGPYGVSQGKVIPPGLKWQGYPAGSFDQGNLTVQEMFDCDGSKGINAILFETSQYG